MQLKGSYGRKIFVFSLFMTSFNVSLLSLVVSEIETAL